MLKDRRAVLRIADELFWVLRREGLPMATSQAIDAVRSIVLVGFDSPQDLREALASVIVQRRRDRGRFDRAFDAFFSRSGHRRTLWERLEANGFSASELDVLRDLLDRLAASSPDGAGATMLHRGADLDRLLHLAGTSRVLGGMQSPLQAGFYTHRLLERLGAREAHDTLGAIRPRLVDAMGEERGAALASALEAELLAASDDVRAFVKQTLEQREQYEGAPRDLMTAPFDSLDDDEVEEVRRAVRWFAQRLRGGERVRRKRARKGRIDPHRTLKSAMRTDGVPFALARRTRRRDKPRLVILCDVSESVRAVARFLLELAYGAQELLSGTRTFVFVSELGETTRLFEENPVESALARAYSGAVVSVSHNSNYGRALRAFERAVVPELDRRTTVVVLGDGRTNYLDPAVEVLDKVRLRARALLWLCPEPRAAWASGDSAMLRYAPKCTNVLEVRCARDLEDAARLIMTVK